jgi:hypothetical protein
MEGCVQFLSKCKQGFFFNKFGANNMVKMAHLQFSHKIDHNSQFMASKQNNQAHGHMQDIVHDNVTIFSRKVRVFMQKIFMEGCVQFLSKCKQGFFLMNFVQTIW